MIDSAHSKLFLTIGLATAIAAGLAAPAMAATDTPRVTTSAPAATTSSPAAAAVSAKPAKPVVDELVLVESIQLTPVSLASKIIGSALHTADNKKVGSVKDLLIGENNRIDAVTVGVGGFLGMDETYLAFPMKDISFSSESGSLRITTDLTKAAIEQAAKRK
ncbi:MAG: PRC-barrel domain-containing protein [Burkholderiaceae bacterium]